MVINGNIIRDSLHISRTRRERINHSPDFLSSSSRARNLIKVDRMWEENTTRRDHFILFALATRKGNGIIIPFISYYISSLKVSGARESNGKNSFYFNFGIFHAQLAAFLILVCIMVFSSYLNNQHGPAKPTMLSL